MEERTMPAGQPLKFKTPKILKEKCDKYFHDCLYEINKDGEEVLREHQIPFTITGLALALGTSRATLMNYEKKEKYFNTVKEAKTKVENYAEKRLFGNNATGPIFALKNFGWKDKSEVDQNTKISLKKSTQDFLSQVTGEGEAWQK